jgi:hypothetical protein
MSPTNVRQQFQRMPGNDEAEQIGYSYFSSHEACPGQVSILNNKKARGEITSRFVDSNFD